MFASQIEIMIISVIKPLGITSFGVVAKVRKITGIKKVGHAGTLDPLATGVLVVAIGRESTKKIDALMSGKKSYLADITFGAYSETDDAEGTKDIVVVQRVPEKYEIDTTLKSFVGEILQIPPQYSAVKVGGQRAYTLARKGLRAEFTPRKVTIHSIEMLDYSWPKVKIRVDCGKGVYIRTIARDLGDKLGVGGYISKLDRTRVGDYTYENSLTFDNLGNTLPELIKKSQGV